MKLCIDAACPNIESLLTSHAVRFHSSMVMVPSGILPVGFFSSHSFQPALLMLSRTRRYWRCRPATQLDIAKLRGFLLRDRGLGAIKILAARGTPSFKRGNLASREPGAALGGLCLHGAAVHRVLRRAQVRARGRVAAADGIRAGEIIQGCAVRPGCRALAAYRPRQGGRSHALGNGECMGRRRRASRVGDDSKVVGDPIDDVAAGKSRAMGA